MPDTIYQAITADKYELPLFWADTPRELAEILGTTAHRISKALCANAKIKLKERPTRNGRQKAQWCRIIKIDLQEVPQ